MMRLRAIRLPTLLAVLLSMACQAGDAPPADEGGAGAGMAGDRAPPLLAMNAFYYYDDVDRAWAFYTEILGLRTVVDYGFAKILRVAESSYLTLVDAKEGMHSTDEPRSVTLAIVTEEVEGWYDYLSSRGVPMRSDLGTTAGSPHDGFVAVDPEGDLLEFERFNPHAENERLIPALAEAGALYAAAGVETSRPGSLGVQATVLWLYYDDIERMQRFYRDALGRDIIVDQGWAKVFPVSSTGYIGLVDGERGLHQATAEKSVTVSFFTDDAEGWLAYMQGREGFEFRTPELVDESGMVSVFVGYDPEGYFLEWDTFLDREGNEALLKLLGSR